MNKVELIAAVAEKSGLSKKDAEKAVSAVLDSVVEAVAKEDKVQLVGFGTFEVKKRLERILVNPGTGQRMLVPPKLVLGFKPIAAIKESLKKGEEEA